MKNIGYILTVLLAANVAVGQVQSVDISGGSRQAPRQLPSAQSTTVQVQTQTETLPTTYVEASPLVESRAEQLRKQREAAEMNTEMSVSSKLMEDIRKNRNRNKLIIYGVFGAMFLAVVIIVYFKVIAWLKLINC